MSRAGAPANAVRLARRELRWGVRGFGTFLGCLALGVGAIAGIGSLAAAVVAGIRGDAQALLGGDVSARLAYRTADPAEERFLAASGKLSQVALLRAMARTPDGAHHSLIELKAVDAAYPLYGNMALAPARSLGAALAERDGRFGAVVAPALLDRLGIAPGDPIEIGNAVLQVRATIEREPDAVLSGLSLGPRVMISEAALAATGLIAPGALVTYEYRVRLPPGSDAAAWTRAAHARFPAAGWRLRSYENAAPALQRLIRRLALFLGLVGLTALIVGGLGIGNAVAGYVAGKTQTIATLKCLGASTRLVFAAYLIQILVLALVGIAGGLVVGALVPAALSPLLSSVLPTPLASGLHWRPLAMAASFGLLTTLVFTLWPLAAIERVPAAALFRAPVEAGRRPIPLAAALATALAAAALAALAVLGASDRTVALWYLVGILAAFAVFRGAAAGIVLGARRLGRPRRPMLRLALANLSRPGAPTARIVVSLGIGLAVLVAVALVEGNLTREVERRLPEDAPAFFFIDIQPAQLAGFAQIVDATPGARFSQVPMLRGRITRLDGVPVDEAHVEPDARWAVRSDRGLTYSATIPEGSSLAAGTWWPPDYKGPPLVSFDSGLARGMGLTVGDTLTVNLLGREITAKIANLRKIDWTRLGINFAMVFAPGTLDAAPQTHLAAVYLPKDEADGLVRRVGDRFPNVSAIAVGDALAQIDGLIRMIGDAVRMTALITLAAGVLVLGGAIAAGQRRRVYDAVVLKVLGATRRTVAAGFMIEHGLLGIVSALLAGGIGTLAAYVVVTGPMRGSFVFLPRPLAATLVLASFLTVTLGFAQTWRALGTPAAPLLRHE